MKPLGAATNAESVPQRCEAQDEIPCGPGATRWRGGYGPLASKLASGLSTCASIARSLASAARRRTPTEEE